MRQWEYLHITIEYYLNHSSISMHTKMKYTENGTSTVCESESIADILNTQGPKGWELVSIMAVGLYWDLFFKKERDS